MLSFGASPAVDFLPDETSRAWVAEGLRAWTARLGVSAQGSQLVPVPPKPHPRDLDHLFDLICGVQAVVGQREVEFALVEMEPGQPPVPPGFEPLGRPEGQLMHTFARGPDLAIVVVPTVFRQAALLFASVARELGRIAIHRVGAPDRAPEDREADAELSATALGLGAWVTNGAYVFQNACCGGGCGVDLSSLRAGLSMPEAAFALALDGHRRSLSRRAVVRDLEATQKAAVKRSWRHLRTRPDPISALPAPRPAALGE